MEGKVAGTPKKDIALDTDWLTASLVTLGLLFIFLVIGFDFWRLVHGEFAFQRLPRQPSSSRLWDSLFGAYAIVMCVVIVTKSAERILRFAFGLLSVAILADFLMLWLPPLDWVTQTLSTASLVTGLPAFVLLAIYGLRWFKRKVVHV